MRTSETEDLRAHAERWRHYDPLLDTPDLFLRFAELHDGELSTEQVLGWVREYGNLGLGSAWEAGQDPVSKPSLYRAQNAVSLDDSLASFTLTDPIDGFRDEAILAAAVLRMYEVALGGDEEEAKKLLLLDFPFIPLVCESKSLSHSDLAHSIFGGCLSTELQEAAKQSISEIQKFSPSESERTVNFVSQIANVYYKGYLDYAFQLSIHIAYKRFRALFYPQSLLDTKDSATSTAATITTIKP